MNVSKSRFCRTLIKQIKLAQDSKYYSKSDCEAKRKNHLCEAKQLKNIFKILEKNAKKNLKIAKKLNIAKIRIVQNLRNKTDF